MASITITTTHKCPRCAGTHLVTRGRASEENTGLIYAPMQCDACGHCFKIYMGVANNRNILNTIHENKIYTPFNPTKVVAPNIPQYRVTVILPKEVLTWRDTRFLYMETDGLPLTLSVNVMKPTSRDSNQYPPGPAEDPRLHWDDHVGKRGSTLTFESARVHGTVYEVVSVPQHSRKEL